MFVEMYDADREFVNFVNVLNVGLDEYESWLCLRIEDPALRELSVNSDLSYRLGALLDSFLQDVDGRLFFCSDQDVYILTKDMSPSSLEGIGYDVCDLLLDRHSMTTRVSVYLLSDQQSHLDSYALHDESVFQSPILKSSRENIDIMPDPAKFNFSDLEQVVGTKILLVEDDRTTTRLVTAAMEDTCRVDTASDVSSGLARFMNTTPDLIFLDIGLPDGDGCQALEFMLWNDPDAYIVMFSSHDDQDTVSKALRLGAKGFISKPFVKERMLDHLHAYARTAV